ncbi:MAG TPA: DUF4352 domain-containing protein [Methanothrix sp.]|jgi:hypothetical protein|nr:DUF4352 domain-containing protein [Methanothrix sp.]HOV81175.1 DUF4352 domain-containing protein [Methanothrix sp.]HPC89014.1 DUF4352 domain-containing protein [Methanothrix sp.]HQE86779.1 DUF4352 domain-containing protein [Methanothrix sp.]HQI67408.1 DUF4352 domain-containing protein [Methanothrix sp.]
MRWLALALLVLLAAGASQAYPLYGGNGAVNCTVFGIFKDPSSGESKTILTVDLSLIRVNASNSVPVAASFQLTDGNDRVFDIAQAYCRDLDRERRLIAFLVPKETIARILTVSPSPGQSAGDQFSIRFPELLNISNENVTLLYYGMQRSIVNSNKKTVELDVSLTNNGSEKLSIDAGNFTLKDQWGWIYKSSEYDSFGRKGLSAAVLQPNETVRSGLIFASLSPMSRPAELVYRYTDGTTYSLNIDEEAGINAGLLQPRECIDCNKPQEEESDSSLAGSIKATKARLAKVKKSNSSEEKTEPKGRDEL